MWVQDLAKKKQELVQKERERREDARRKVQVKTEIAQCHCGSGDKLRLSLHNVIVVLVTS